ncbi:MAG: hypothetical protein HY042_04135 [Spirochaetia bacterium]|nr:hypothetical protein [Spirochaetia bacterium]
MNSDKAISLPVKEVSHLKIMLATWYSFLREQVDSLSKEEFSRFLTTPVIYDLNKDEIEILFTGSEELLKKFKEHVFRGS